MKMFRDIFGSHNPVKRLLACIGWAKYFIVHKDISKTKQSLAQNASGSEVNTPAFSIID